MRRPDAAMIVWMCASIAGCATSSIDMAPPQPDRPWIPTTTATGEIVPGVASKTAPVGEASYVLPSNSALLDVPPGPTLDADRVYSLADLIDVAESNNPLTRIAWNDARRVALAAGNARSTYLPRLTATAVGVAVDSSGHESLPGSNVEASSHGTISALSLQWLLFDFGERSAVIEAAEQASVISNIAFTAAHQRVIYEVSVAFYAHSAARASVTAATRSQKNAEAVQVAAEQRRSNGVATTVEVAQARQARAQADLAVVQATGAVSDTYLSLLAAVGVSPLTTLQIADVSDRPLPANSDSVDEIVANALSRRPDLLGAYAAQKASQANVRATEAEFLPKLFVAATGAYNSDDLDITGLPAVGQQPPTLNVSGNHYVGSVLAGVTVPIYDAGTRSAALAQAKAEADNAQAKLDHLRDEAMREVVASNNALRTSIAAYHASDALADAAQTTFDAALDAYRNGVASITDVTVAETALLQARNAMNVAHSTALSAAATLALATGALGAAPQ